MGEFGVTPVCRPTDSAVRKPEGGCHARFPEKDRLGIHVLLCSLRSRFRQQTIPIFDYLLIETCWHATGEDLCKERFLTAGKKPLQDPLGKLPIRVGVLARSGGSKTSPKGLSPFTVSMVIGPVGPQVMWDIYSSCSSSPIS